MVTGQNYAFVQHNWLDLRGSVFTSELARYATGCRSGLVNVGVYQTEFQRCRRTQRISFARAVSEYLAVQQRYGQHLTLNQRLRHAKLVYTVTQDIDVLLHRIFTRFTQTSIAHTASQAGSLPGVEITRSGMAIAQIRNGFITSFSVAESQCSGRSCFSYATVVYGMPFHADRCAGYRYFVPEFAKRGVHIHFHQEVNAATQVKAELHRLERE